MIWQDLFVARRVPDAELAQGIGIVFGVSVARIQVVDEIMDDTRTEGDAVLVEREYVAGEFKMRLAVYLIGVPPPADDVPQVVALSRALDAPCLMSDDSLDPLRWILIMPDGQVSIVMLDGDALDRDEYSLAADRANTATMTQLPQPALTDL